VPPELVLFLIASATAVATGLGAIPVVLLGDRAGGWQPMTAGLTAGLMTAAAVIGLLLPAWRRGTPLDMLAGASAGVAFLLASRALLGGRDVHVGRLRGASVRRAVLVFGVLFLHSLPEGFAIGTAYAVDPGGLGVFIVLAIGLQNVPEGTSVAVPMLAGGFRPRAVIGAAVLTSVPQPVGALMAYRLVEEIEALLPLSFAFAGAAMLALVVAELLPELGREPRRAESWLGGLAGAAVMILLAVALGPEL